MKADFSASEGGRVSRSLRKAFGPFEFFLSPFPPREWRLWLFVVVSGFLAIGCASSYTAENTDSHRLELENCKGDPKTLLVCPQNRRLFSDVDLIEAHVQRTPSSILVVLYYGNSGYDKKGYVVLSSGSTSVKSKIFGIEEKQRRSISVALPATVQTDSLLVSTTMWGD